MAQEEQGKYRFNDFEVALGPRLIRRNGNPVPVGSRSFDLLVYLLEHAHRVVTKAELMDALWPGAHVEESNLSQHIFLLRKALSGAQSGDKLIVTMPGRGYRFTAAVTRDEPAAAPAAGRFQAQPARSGFSGQDAALQEDRPAIASPSASLNSQPEPSVRFRLDAEGSPDSGSEPGTSHTHARRREAQPEPLSEADSGDEDSPAARPSPWPFALAAAVVLLAACGWLGWRWFQPRQPPQQPGLLIANFDNNSGNPQFDLALSKALALDLQQSPFLRVSAEEQVWQAFRQIKAGPRDSAEVCRRLGDRVYVTGEIHRIAQKYLLTLRAYGCGPGVSSSAPSNLAAPNLFQSGFSGPTFGATLAGNKGLANSPDAVLPVLDRMAVDLRRQLGEPPQSLARFNKPLFAAGAPSLDALKAYAQASLLELEGKFNDSVPLLQRSVEIDPQFTPAFADLGRVYSRLGSPDLAAAALARAYELHDSAGEYARLAIDLDYESLAKGDLQAAIRTEKEATALYPLDAGFPANLASLYLEAGKPALAIEPAQHALALNPGNAQSYIDLARAQMHLEQLDEAAQTCRKAIERHLDGEEIHAILLDLAYLRLDQPAMDEQFAWARGIEDDNAEAYMQTQRGLMEFAEGKVRAAQATFSSLAELYRKRDQSGRAVALLGAVPRIEAELGLLQAAQSLLERLPEDSGSADIPVAWAEVGETSRAEAELQRALDEHPTGTLWQGEGAPQIRASIDLNRHEPEAAIEALQDAAPYDLLSFRLPALRGRAYLAAGEPELAETEFHKILDHSGIEPLSYNYPLAYLGLARALALQGKIVDARAAYNVLFSIWKDADSDLPRLKAAKEEYARLAGTAAKPKSASAARSSAKPASSRR